MNIKLYGWDTPLKVPNERLYKGSAPKEPKISIIVPTLNQSDTLEHTILSIINQEYLNYELIIIDGGSTDLTDAVVNRYSDWITLYTSEKDGGQSEAINKGMKLASGDILAWMNSDDYYLPRAFKTVSELIGGDSKVDIVVGSGIIVDRYCNFLKTIPGLRMIKEGLLEWEKDKWIMQQSCFWTPRIWEKCGGVDETLTLLMDLDLWLRFAENGQSLVTDSCLAVMRYYPGAKSVSLKKKAVEELAYIYAKNQEFRLLRNLVAALNETKAHLADELALKDRKLSSRILRRLRIDI